MPSKEMGISLVKPTPGRNHIHDGLYISLLLSPESLFVAFQFLPCLLDQLMSFDQFVDGAHGRETDGMLGAGIKAGYTGHHAV